MYFFDNIQYVRMGLLIGKHRPELVSELMKVETLTEVGILINKELGTNIVRGEPLSSVVKTITEALEK